MSNEPNPSLPPTDKPQGLLTGKPWLVAGVSRTYWYRAWSAGQVPEPVALPGSERRWRVQDLIDWVKNLKPSPKRRKSSRRRDEVAA